MLANGESLQRRAQIPRATYRLQFNENFRLRDALALVPYLHELGISHIYASPLFKACPHSTHGYDVCDFNQLNPELGTETDLADLVAALRARKMGLVLDIVPNHMGIGPKNPWWWDVLKHGCESQFADYFDIDWDSSDPRTRRKVLLPVLAERYDHVLTRGDLKLENAGNTIVLRYFDNLFPITALASGLPSDLGEVNSNPDALDALIQQQHYRLTFHGYADGELNYRRFFAVNSLAGLRVEDENVFNDSHALLRQWLERGWVDGLRVDHPDGLRDPEQYLHHLRTIAPNAWIIVEKILEPGEALPASWPVAGTTGYDFLNCVNGLFVDSASEKSLADFYVEFTGETTDYAALVIEKKRGVLVDLFVAEVNRLTDLLLQIAARHWRSRDFTRGEFHDAIVELAVHFPVYRSYVRDVVRPEDAKHIEMASRMATQHRSDLSELFDFLRDTLWLKFSGETENKFVARFQQLTGPAMAKGVEDTVFYCFNRFTSLNEVGGDPSRFGISVEDFYETYRAQQMTWPDSMLSTSTHDTKRSEDVRARLNALSEIPAQWAETVRRWSAMNERHRRNDWPDRNAEYLLYQTLVGAWPLPVERVVAYMEKAVREAKQHTSWKRYDEKYETTLRGFIGGLLNDSAFTNDLAQFVSVLTDAGYVNALAQTLIKLTAPGVADIYQGCELWDFSLVDPDNRRPVDFGMRQRLLDEMKKLSPEEIWGRRDEGLPKLWLIQRTLSLRARQPDLFSDPCEKISASGAGAAHIMAFIRGGQAVAVVPRLVVGIKNDWVDTFLKLPEGNWRNELTDEYFPDVVPLGALLQKFPVALLVKDESHP